MERLAEIQELVVIDCGNGSEIFRIGAGVRQWQGDWTQEVESEAMQDQALVEVVRTG